MRLLGCWLAWSLLAPAQERWVEVRSGPFHLLSAAGAREAQQTLGELEQLRHLLGRVLSSDDLGSAWPIGVLIFRRGSSERPLAPALGRDRYLATLIAETPPDFSWRRELLRLLLEANTRRLPADIEAGLLDYYAMAEIRGVRIRVGLPPQQPNLAWARIHLLSLHPNYYGKLRPLLYNLQQMGDSEPAWRNALGTDRAALDEQAKAYLRAGKFPEETFSGLPLDARKDFRALPLDPPASHLVMADLRLAQGRVGEAQTLYQAALAANPGNPEALEGLAFCQLALGATDLARQSLKQAIAAGSRNARLYLEAARQEPNFARAVAHARKAAELNPRWAEPYRFLAERETDLTRRLQALERAANLAPREAALWSALAEAQEQANDFRAASRSWAAAELAAVDQAERARIREARRTLAQRRLEAEAAARRRAAEEQARELARSKEEALRRIREAEARANRQAGPPPAQVVPWFETEAPSAKVQGRLRQIDCLRGAARLVIETAPGQAVRLLIRDPAKVVVLGGGRLELACGVQKQARMVAVEYFPKPDAALGAAGEVATIEYR